MGESGGQREIGGARPCAGVAACVWSAALTVLDLSKALCCPSQSVPEQRAQGDHHHLAATRDARTHSLTQCSAALARVGTQRSGVGGPGWVVAAYQPRGGRVYIDADDMAAAGHKQIG